MNTATGRIGFTTIRCLPELEGKPLNDLTAAYLTALRPAVIEIIRGGVMKSDAITWRVRVFLADDGTIESVEQEVSVELPEDVAHGHDLRCRLADL